MGDARVIEFLAEFEEHGALSVFYGELDYHLPGKFNREAV